MHRAQRRDRRCVSASKSLRHLVKHRPTQAEVKAKEERQTGIEAPAGLPRPPVSDNGEPLGRAMHSLGTHATPCTHAPRRLQRDASG